MKQTLILLGLAAILILSACIRIVPKTGDGAGGSSVPVGELLSFGYSPGYGDMEGGSHYDRLEKTESGEWIIESRNRNSIGEPMIVTTYAVSADAVSRFEEFLKEKGILSLADRPDSDLFATDYSPWSYSLTFDNSQVGGDAYESYYIGEYKEYSKRDRELLKELGQQFAGLYGEIISETEDSEP